MVKRSESSKGRKDRKRSRFVLHPDEMTSRSPEEIELAIEKRKAEIEEYRKKMLAGTSEKPPNEEVSKGQEDNGS